jgi:hypothetical protein
LALREFDAGLRLAQLDLPLTIVAIGPSSTTGIGATSPDRSYPNRSEVELRQRFPVLDILVVNRTRCCAATTSPPTTN